MDYFQTMGYLENLFEPRKSHFNTTSTWNFILQHLRLPQKVHIPKTAIKPKTTTTYYMHTFVTSKWMHMVYSDGFGVYISYAYWEVIQAINSLIFLYSKYYSFSLKLFFKEYSFGSIRINSNIHGYFASFSQYFIFITLLPILGILSYQLKM